MKNFLKTLLVNTSLATGFLVLLWLVIWAASFGAAAGLIASVYFIATIISYMSYSINNIQ